MKKESFELEAISLEESQQLIESEKIIQSGVKTFVEVGIELEKVRVKRLYRSEFRTFQEYCVRRWNFSQGRANQLISAAHTINAIPDEIATLVTTETAARALEKVKRNGAKSPEMRRLNKLLKNAAKKKSKVTATDIEEVAKPRNEPPPEPAPEIGFSFPLTEFRKFLERQKPEDAEKFAELAQQFGNGVADLTSPLLLAQFTKALHALEARIPEGDEKHHDKYGAVLTAAAGRQMNITKPRSAHNPYSSNRG